MPKEFPQFSVKCVFFFIAYALSSADFESGARIILSFISIAIYSSVEIKQFLGEKKG